MKRRGGGVESGGMTIEPGAWFAVQLRLLALENSSDDLLVRFSLIGAEVTCVICFRDLPDDRRRIRVPTTRQECKMLVQLWAKRISDTAASISGLRFSVANHVEFSIREAYGMSPRLIARVKRGRWKMGTVPRDSDAAVTRARARGPRSPRQ
jgi:hypothetical protein